MAAPIYYLGDEEFFTFLERTSQAFREHEIPHMIVGGVANQIHVVKYLENIFGKHIQELSEDPSVELDEYLRRTNDLDVALRIPVPKEIGNGGRDAYVANRIFGVLDTLVGEGLYESPTGDNLVNLELTRKAHKSPEFMLDITGNKHQTNVVKLNIYTGPECLPKLDLDQFDGALYDTFLKRAQEVTLQFGEQTAPITLRVQSMEDLIATKMVRWKPRDQADVYSLAAHDKIVGGKINYRQVEQALFNIDGEHLRGCKNGESTPLSERYHSFRANVKTLEGATGIMHG